MSPVLTLPVLALSETWFMAAVLFGVVLLFSLVLLLITRYKRCPSNKILVVYGKVGGGQASKCLHGGGAFVIPLIQDYDFLDLEPIQIEIPLRGALSAENIRVNVPSVFTVAIGTEPAVMQNAAIRLLGLSKEQFENQARDIIFGQLRQVIASMHIEEINRDRDSFLTAIQKQMEPELRKVGLVLINVNITDITDESGYIEAIGRKAAATAVQQAEIDVAEQVKKGQVGVANANRERDVSVADAEKEREIGKKTAERERTVQVAALDRDEKVGEQKAAFERDAAIADAEREKRIRVADADALAVKGENTAKAVVAQTEADLQVQRAEAYQRGETRRRLAEAEVLRAQYEAQAVAAKAEALKVEAEQLAALLAPARAQKARVDGLGLALGQFEILAKKGEGLGRIVQACGSAEAAFQMLMLEHIEKLSENAAQAIQNIKFDKIVVWDGGAAGGPGGAQPGATAGFLRNLAGSLPPMLHMMRDIGGVKMPDYFGKLVPGDEASAAAAAAAEGEAKDKGPAAPGA